MLLDVVVISHTQCIETLQQVSEKNNIICLGYVVFLKNPSHAGWDAVGVISKICFKIGEAL